MASRPYRSLADQQPQRASELSAQQAAYEALNAAGLKNASGKTRDLIWAATVQCGLGSVPAKRSGAPADAAIVRQAAERNDLLREQGIPLPWDYVTEWEVTDFWTRERCLAAGTISFKQLRGYAADTGECCTQPPRTYSYI